MEEIKPGLMKVTVLVCTRNRPASIKACILSILKNSYPDFEFLVVDQSTDNETKEIVKKYTRSDKPIKYLHMSARGKPRALNLGVKESLGDIIAQTDDDCIVAEDWLGQIVEAFQKNPDVAVVFGSVVDIKAVVGAKRARGLIKDGKFAGRLSKLSFVGDAANRAVKRMVYQKIKGHDEILEVENPLLGSEDQDFAYRALKAGFKILTARNIIVTHHMYRIRDMKSYLSVSGGTQVGIGALYMKHIRCLDFIAMRLLSAAWIGRMRQIMQFAFSVERMHTGIPRVRVAVLFFLWFKYTYWTVLGMIKSLKYPVDKTYCLFIPK